MILAIIWTGLTATVLVINLWGLADARGDLRFLIRVNGGGNGRRDRRIIVARAHVREEMAMVWVQFCFLAAGVLRISLGPPPNERVDLYRTITTALFLSAQVVMIINSLEKRRYRHQVIRAKRRMLDELGSTDTRG